MFQPGSNIVVKSKQCYLILTRDGFEVVIGDNDELLNFETAMSVELEDIIRFIEIPHPDIVFLGAD